MKKSLCVLVAPDSFKGSIRSKAVCDAVEKGILQAAPAAQVIKVPLADGGEGTIDALVLNTSGEYFSSEVTGPRGEKVQAQYGILGDGQTAVIEMAAASGLPLLTPEHQNPALTTSYGTGELIREALDRGCRRIILGLGGSATNDYGAGALQALGFSFQDQLGHEIGWGCAELSRVVQIDSTRRLKQLDEVEFTIASDVDNPLLGENGATFTYALQKGAVPDELPGLEQALKHFDQVVTAHVGRSVRDLPGAGAAGGMGAGTAAFLGSSSRSGIELIMELIGFKQIFENRTIDLVITGEGALDAQTAHGKLPVGVARQAKVFGVPVVALVGSKGTGFEAVFEHGIDAVYALCDGTVTKPEAMQDPARYLTQTAARIMENFTQGLAE